MPTRCFHQKELILLSLISIIILNGCIAMAYHGGIFIPKNSPLIRDSLIDYQTEGSFPDGATYHLVKTDNGLAIFEREINGDGALFENHWEDKENDHFAAWVSIPGGGESQPGFEFIVPKDRMKPALRYVYPWQTYTIKKINGVKRPIPFEPTIPVTSLISSKSDLIPGVVLRDASSIGNLAKIDSLLSVDSQLINSQNGIGTTPLICAVRNGQNKAVERLLFKGANIHLRDSSGKTALIHSAFTSHREIVELLISKGAGIKVKSKDGITALHGAAIMGNLEIAQLLINLGADVNAKSNENVTVLHFAVIGGSMKMVELLINKGVEINVADQTGYTPLYYAKQKEIAKKLRQHGGVK
jgi:ankyrin repeat protein